MKLVQFYREEIPADGIHWIDDIFKWSHSRLEGEHNYVQWLFPTKEPSMLHECPVLDDQQIEIFKSDPKLKSRVANAFDLILDFYGFELSSGGIGHPESGIVEEIESANGKDPQAWIRYFNHNFLRITRILRSMRYLGRDDLSKALFNKLKEYREFCTDNSFNYWQDAALGELK